jgi:hypothetical protein
MNFKLTCDGKIVLKENDLESNAEIASKTYAVPVENVVRFGLINFEKNDELAECVFRRPGRRAPCVRCQVYGASFFNCRVRRCHSNPDFDFMENFKNFGGVDGLLRSVMQSGPDQTLNTQTAKRKTTDSMLFLLSNISSLTQSPPPSNDEKDQESNGKAAGPNTSADDSEGRQVESQKNCSGDAGERQESSKVADPKENMEKAESAVGKAVYLVRQAHLLAVMPVRLGAKFIASYFPVDPADGHYTWCVICGLSGNVMCCDGCSNVVHTHCVGLAEIPDEDWFCEKCVDERKSSPKDVEEVPQSMEGAANKVLATPDAFKTTAAVENGIAINVPPSTAGTGNDEENNNESASQKKVQLPLVRPEITDDVFDERAADLDCLISEINATRMPPVMPSTPAAETGDDTDKANSTDQNKKAAEEKQDSKGSNDEPVDESEVEGDDSIIPIGTGFVKCFDGLGNFGGEVVGLPSGPRPYYFVEYEDGDSEDMTFLELVGLLPADEGEKYKKGQASSSEQTLSSSTAKPPRRRMMPPGTIENDGASGRKQPQRPRKSSPQHSQKKPDREAGGPKRGRGRPRKLSNDEDSKGNENTRQPQRKPRRPWKSKAAAAEEITEPKRKKRGRPRKNPVVDITDVEQTAAPVGMKRKRLRKNPVVESKAEDNDVEEVQATQRKRGRPRKSRNRDVEDVKEERRRSRSSPSGETEEARRSRGRRSSRETAVKHEDDDVPAPSMDVLAEVQKLADEDSPPKERRSGRRIRAPKR